MSVLQGPISVPANVQAHLHGYSGGAVTAGAYLVEVALPARGRIGGIQASAGTAGSGTGSTVLDVLLNGTSIYARAGDKPTLAAASTGSFASSRPHTRAVQAGDVLAIQVSTVPGGSGHARVAVGVAIEYPDRAI